MRIQEQNAKPISVIIGNPPYNANQQNENDNNRNRTYPEIDRRISETYIAASTAQKTKQYDMYKRFIRWASDRLNDDGIIAFITNRAYLDKMQDDGFRRVVSDEFDDVYIFDLGGDLREHKGVGNVFYIRTGVAIGFLVRQKATQGTCNIHYYAIEDGKSGAEKLSELQGLNIGTVDFGNIVPDRRNNWLNQSNSNFETLTHLATRQTKLAKTNNDEQAIFRLYTLGVVTNRDQWVYDFDPDRLGCKVRAFIDEYEKSRAQYGGKEFDDVELGKVIKWTRDLKRQLRLDSSNVFDQPSIRETLYRPFTNKFLYYHQSLNEMQYQMPQVFPHYEKLDNRVICFQSTGARRPFSTLATDNLTDLHLFFDGTQCLPLYRYTPDGDRVSNLTRWGLKKIRDHYGDDGITAEDVFAYTYAALHDPKYREAYAVDLLQEFPRLPLHRNFYKWAGLGGYLLDLHIGFESATLWNIERVDTDTLAAKPILRADKERGHIALDHQTTLTGIPDSAWQYRLGSRTALEWVLDQHKERKPRDPTIRERFNTYRFADHKERVIDLLQRVCTVSVETVRIVDQLAELSDIEPTQDQQSNPQFVTLPRSGPFN